MTRAGAEEVGVIAALVAAAGVAIDRAIRSVAQIETLRTRRTIGGAGTGLDRRRIQLAGAPHRAVIELHFLDLVLTAGKGREKVNRHRSFWPLRV